MTVLADFNIIIPENYANVFVQPGQRSRLGTKFNAGGRLGEGSGQTGALGAFIMFSVLNLPVPLHVFVNGEGPIGTMDPNPPYSDYTSGHACITGVASNTFDYLFGDGPLNLDLYSDVTKTTRRYDSAGALDEQTMNARIWLGVHFRKAMTDGNRLGHQVSAWTIGRQFQPTD